MALSPSHTVADVGSNPVASTIKFSTARWAASLGIPTLGASLLIGLGCEQATIGNLIEQEKLGTAWRRRRFGRCGRWCLSMLDAGGTQATVEVACKLVAELLPRVNDVRREPIPASELILGTNCGGSDGNSGVTANPALGVAADLVVAAGGTVVIGETTELYGAEHLLIRRARTPEIAAALVERMRWWEWYTGVFGAAIDNNPSPGNKQGGITTIYEKSLGAVIKGGSSALSAVYQYTETIECKAVWSSWTHRGSTQ